MRLTRCCALAVPFVLLAACGESPDGAASSKQVLSPERSQLSLRRGPYLVGSKTIFVRDPARQFDQWNRIYGSADYKALLDHLETIGEPRTLVTEVWYPVAPPEDCEGDEPRLRPRRSVDFRSPRRLALPGHRRW
jgi:hypothetical protein